jgi:GTP-binding protein
MNGVRPIVALVGRPNVGKSTLFNRLVGKPVAIVHDRPGVTRDRHYADAHALGREYTLIDTGGFDPYGDDQMKKGITVQLQVAIDEADVIVCLLDATLPATSADSDEMRLLRETQKPVIYAANKADSNNIEVGGHDLYRLGMDHIHFISALHGRGVGEFEGAIIDALPPVVAAPEDDADDENRPLRIAIVGRPNAGKSSIINRLLGEERLLVDDRPGTTRDPIDSLVERRGKRYQLVDTAGLRRKSQVTKSRDGVEAASVVQAVRSIDRAEVVILMCDARRGVEEQDAKILGLALDRGRSIVIALNKIDLLRGDAKKDAERSAREVLSFAPWAPITTVSAKTGRGIEKLLMVARRSNASFNKRVKTGELNRFFETVLASHPPPIQGGRAPRFYFMTQAHARPPTFMVVTSHPDNLHFSYQRYVINALRKRFGFEGTPIRVHYRRKDRKPKGQKKYDNPG